MTDRVDPARAEALWQALGRAGPSPKAGTPLPALFHHIYFWTVDAPGALGRDGQATLAHLIPDLGLPHRIWAGGRFTFHAPFLAGTRAERVSRVAGLTRKRGPSGEMAFLTLRHEIRQRGGLVISEEQDLVYGRPGRVEAADPPGMGDNPDRRAPLSFDPVVLFRYSALTMNAHRPHHDEAFAKREGFDGLVVHWPLLALCLAVFAEAEMGPLAAFSFRAANPLLGGEAAEILADGERLWVVGPEGRAVMSARAG